MTFFLTLTIYLESWSWCNTIRCWGRWSSYTATTALFGTQGIGEAAFFGWRSCDLDLATKKGSPSAGHHQEFDWCEESELKLCESHLFVNALWRRQKLDVLHKTPLHLCIQELDHPQCNSYGSRADAMWHYQWCVSSSGSEVVRSWHLEIFVINLW